MTKNNLAIRNLLIPVALHLLLVGAYAVVDPCNNNAGCMAGSLTAYFIILCTAPTLLVLIVASIVQARINRPDFNKYLKINLTLALLPFVIVVALLVIFK